MKFKGISYDIGTEYIPGTLTRTGLSAEIIARDMFAIRNTLNCNSVRIFGRDSGLLLLSSEIALQAGLNVWVSPRCINFDIESTLEYINKIAKEIEVLKSKFSNLEIVFVVAAEASLDTKGFLKGETIDDRIQRLANPLFFIKKAIGFRPPYQKGFNEFLSQAVFATKNFFSGRITYAAGMWEIVDWTSFDFISVNLYKASFNKSYFDKTIKKLNSKGKPLAITEFGCCSYEGADKKGPTGYTILDKKSNPPVFKEKCERSEKTQAEYNLDLLKTFEKEKVNATFVFDFYSQQHSYNTIPELDFDKASFSITKSIGQNKWAPKLSFDTISQFYKELK